MAVQTNDVRQIRKKKKIKSLIKKLVILLCIIVAIIAAVFTKDKWLPVFDGIVYRIENIFNKHEYEKNFPIKIGTSSTFEIAQFQDKIVLISDTDIKIIDRDGKTDRNSQHGMSTPVVKSENERAMIYDLGGTKLIMESRSKTVYTKDFSEKIIYAQLSRKGYAAVVTASEVNSCELNIFDSKGNKIFYSSFNQKIIDIAFNYDSNGCIVSTIGAKGGQFISQQHSFEFKKEKEIWANDSQATLVMKSSSTKKSDIILIGDNMYSVLASTGKQKYTYEISENVIDYSSEGEISAIVTYNLKRRATELIIFDYDKPNSIQISDEFKNVHVVDDKIYLLTKHELSVYSSRGELVEKKTLDKYYSDFVAIDNYIYLLGNQEIDIIKLKA